LERMIAGDGSPGQPLVAKDPDPLASSVALYLISAGVRVDTDVLSRWLYLVPVLFLEVGSAFGLVVAGACSSDKDTVACRPVGRRRSWWELFAIFLGNRSTVAGRVAVVSPTVSNAQQRLRQLKSDGALVVEALRAAGR